MAGVLCFFYPNARFKQNMLWLPTYPGGQKFYVRIITFSERNLNILDFTRIADVSFVWMFLLLRFYYTFLAGCRSNYSNEERNFIMPVNSRNTLFYLKLSRYNLYWFPGYPKINNDLTGPWVWILWIFVKVPGLIYYAGSVFFERRLILIRLK